MPSTVIRNYSYHQDINALKITFVTGRRYVYHDVPQAVYDDFRMARSRGTFFNHHIRDHYRYREITHEEA